MTRVAYYSGGFVDFYARDTACIFSIRFNIHTDFERFFFFFFFFVQWELSFPLRESSVYDQLWRWFDLFERFPDDSFVVNDHEIF